MHDFSVVDAKSALVELLNAFQSPANLPRLEAARCEAGNDMIRQMQLVFPVVTQIQVRTDGRSEKREFCLVRTLLN